MFYEGEGERTERGVGKGSEGRKGSMTLVILKRMNGTRMSSVGRV